MPWKTMTLRGVKGSPLTNAEMDANLQSVLDYMNGILLPTTAHDLNDYDTPGVYGQNATAGAVAGSNYPIDPTANTPVAGILKVWKGATGGNLAAHQEYRSYYLNNSTIFYRNKTGVTWGDWIRVPKYAEAMTKTALTVATDANTLTTDNTWWTWSASAVMGDNFPPAPVKSAGSMSTIAMSSSYWIQTCILAPSSGRRNIEYRRGGNSTAWGAWKIIAPVSLASDLPTADCGDVYVDGVGWHTWSAAQSKYVYTSNIAVGTVGWWSLRASVPAGQIPLDGQTVSRATYPELTAMVLAGTVPVVTEANWLADPANRGAYTVGNGTSTIRLPDYNGASSGSYGPVFRRGDGTGAGGPGAIQRDAMQNITGSVSPFFRAEGLAPSGAFTITSYGNTPPQPGTFGAVPGDSATITLNASLVARTATETRPVNVAGVWTVHAFGTVVNPGSADAAQLASDYATLNGSFQSTKSKLDALWTGTFMNVSNANGVVISGEFPGIFSAGSTRFKGAAGSAGGATYVQAVPAAAGGTAAFLCRQNESPNASFVMLGNDTTANVARLLFSRHGSGAAITDLVIQSQDQIVGTINRYGGWVLGAAPYARAASTAATITYAGGGTQWGLLMAPQSLEGATAIAFQSAAGVLCGSITSNGSATAFNTSSDYRLKTVTGDADKQAGHTRIMSVRIHDYWWKADGKPDRGVLAHELAETHPNAVTGEKDAMMEMPGYYAAIMPQSVDYSKLVPDLILTVQTMQAKMDAMQEELDSLKQGAA